MHFGRFRHFKVLCSSKLGICVTPSDCIYFRSIKADRDIFNHDFVKKLYVTLYQQIDIKIFKMGLNSETSANFYQFRIRY